MKIDAREKRNLSVPINIWFTKNTRTHATILADETIKESVIDRSNAHAWLS